MPKTKIKGLVLRDGSPTEDIRRACEEWGISPQGLRKRIRKGMSPSEALSAPKWPSPGPWVDHHGNAYPSRNAMARAWGLTEAQLEGRLKRGYTLQQALTTPKGKHVRR